MAFNRSCIGLGLFQFLTAGLLSAKMANYQAISVGMLVPLTILFSAFCRRCFKRHCIVAPLECMGIMPERLGTDPELSNLNNSQNVISESDPLVLKPKSRPAGGLQRATRSSNQEYRPSTLSKTLPQLWIPEYIAHLAEKDIVEDTFELINRSN